MRRKTAAERLADYERTIWKRAVHAQPKNKIKRSLFRWAWKHRIYPPYPGVSVARVQLMMTIIEVRNERYWEQRNER